MPPRAKPAPINIMANSPCMDSIGLRAKEGHTQCSQAEHIHRWIIMDTMARAALVQSDVIFQQGTLKNVVHTDQKTIDFQMMLVSLQSFTCKSQGLVINSSSTTL